MMKSKNSRHLIATPPYSDHTISMAWKHDAEIVRDILELRHLNFCHVH